jgi:hypothetical protein
MSDRKARALEAAAAQMVEDHARKDITAHEQLGNACDTHHAAMTDGMVLVSREDYAWLVHMVPCASPHLRSKRDSERLDRLREALKVEG